MYGSAEQWPESERTCFLPQSWPGTGGETESQIWTTHWILGNTCSAWQRGAVAILKSRQPAHGHVQVGVWKVKPGQHCGWFEA